MRSVLALAAALAAPLIVWTPAAQTLGGDSSWALATLCALAGALAGWSALRADTRAGTRLTAVAAVALGSVVAGVLLVSAAYLTLRSFFGAGPSLSL